MCEWVHVRDHHHPAITTGSKTNQPTKKVHTQSEGENNNRNTQLLISRELRREWEMIISHSSRDNRNSNSDTTTYTNSIATRVVQQLPLLSSKCDLFCSLTKKNLSSSEIYDNGSSFSLPSLSSTIFRLSDHFPSHTLCFSLFGWLVVTVWPSHHVDMLSESCMCDSTRSCLFLPFLLSFVSLLVISNIITRMFNSNYATKRHFHWWIRERDEQN